VEFVGSCSAPDDAASVSMMLGLRKAVLIMFMPNVIPDKVVCDRNEIRASTLHNIAIKIPPTGINIDRPANTKAMTASAFKSVSCIRLWLRLNQSINNCVNGKTKQEAHAVKCLASMIASTPQSYRGLEFALPQFMPIRFFHLLAIGRFHFIESLSETRETDLLAARLAGSELTFDSTRAAVFALREIRFLGHVLVH